MARKSGLLEIAHGGTVFLDEIGDVDPLVQPKLLKVLEEKRFQMLGDVRERFVDIRLIAASHANLAEMAREQRTPSSRCAATRGQGMFVSCATSSRGPSCSVTGGVIGHRDLRFEAAPPAVEDESTLTLRELECRHIERVLGDTHGKVEPTARRLGIPRSSLYQKLKDYGLSPSRD